ncbi:MAG: hypothetical protein WAL66_13225 [Nitrososphaeraceae archaeon]
MLEHAPDAYELMMSGKAMADNGNDNWSQQIIPDMLVKSLKTVRGGAIDIDMEGHSAQCLYSQVDQCHLSYEILFN